MNDTRKDRLISNGDSPAATRSRRHTRSRLPVSILLPASALAGLLVLAMVLAAALPADAAWGRSRYEQGERIRLTGLVTDPSGRPIPNLHVVLEASRSHFSLRSFGKAKKDLTRLSGLTNERGEYLLEWPWNDYYNTFELVVGVPIRKPKGERLRILERIDLTREIEKGSPVVNAVVVSDISFVNNLRQFLATIDTEDERKVHRQMGEPDRVQQVNHGDSQEVAWWYFESGQVYRFRDGRLDRVEPFDPVKEF